MSKTTYPVFGNMLPSVNDIQLIVDSFKEEDRKRLTADGIFNPGIVNSTDVYLQEGSNKNTIKINPFIAYTKNGNRIEVSSYYDYLVPEYGKSIINIDEDINVVNREKNIPYWNHYSKNYTNFANANDNVFSIPLTSLKPGAILQGIKIKHIQKFNGCGDVYVSIGTSLEPEKYTPKFLISSDPSDTNIATSNIVYSENGKEPTTIYATFYCSIGYLNNLYSGTADISLCIANVSNVEYEEEYQDSGIPLNNIVGTWNPNTTYYIVVRYKSVGSELTSINIPDDDIDLEIKPFNKRETDSFDFYALRRTGSFIDPLTNDDVKLGHVITDNSGNITVYVNDYNEDLKTYYTDYMTLPSIRFKEFSDTVINDLNDKKLNKSGDTMTGDLTFKDDKGIIFEKENYSIKEQNGNLIFKSDDKGIYLKKEDGYQLFYSDGKIESKILTNNDKTILNEFVGAYLADKDVVKETYAGADGSWYRIYVSGWVEQGGRANVANDGVAYITFLKKMANTNYYANWISCSGATLIGAGTRSADELKETGFRIYNGQDVRMIANWFVCGFMNDAELEDEGENK
ncbi:MAG: hypothetical protein NC222_06475 [Staphylococcus sp.]|nr:hypothetical protein [Staphylococcus sp.]